MFFSKNKAIAADETVINKDTLKKLKAKATILDQLLASQFQKTAMQITENAKLVNHSSSERLTNVEENYQLVEKLAELSSDIAHLSETSVSSAQETSDKSAHSVDQLQDLTDKISQESY